MSSQITGQEELEQVSNGEGTNESKPKAGELAIEAFTEYAKERPEMVALWALGVGFVLGWKLKPW